MSGGDRSGALPPDRVFDADQVEAYAEREPALVAASAPKRVPQVFDPAERRVLQRITDALLGDTTAGLLVAVEGIDAAGKATQAALLAAALGQLLGRPHRVVEVPRYASASGRAIRSWLLREWSAATTDERGHAAHRVEADGAMTQADTVSVDEMAFQALMTYNRYEMAEEIRAAVAVGEVVVLDRWWASSYAYGVAAGLSGDSILRASSQLPQPDAWVLLDLSVIAAGARRKARDRHEGDPGKLERARRSYLELADRLHMAVVDADQTPDAVAADVLSAVRACVDSGRPLRNR